MAFLELLKVIFIGIVEGITEWLPISSTGHMLLVDQFLNLNARPEFKEMFFVIIQLGAIIAVIYMYWSKLWPFRIVRSEKERDSKGRLLSKSPKWRDEYRVGSVGISRPVLLMWIKVIVATIPAGILGLILDDWMEKYAHTPAVIAVALIVYGILFIVIEMRNEKREPRITKLSQISYRDALFLGLFQALAIVPGTSRSGATIVGGLTMGISRKLAAEFSFFMGIPIMFGWSLVKLIKFGMHYSVLEFFEMIFGMVVAFVVSIFVIRFLMNYIKKNSFKVFGIYRIALGLIVILVFIIKAIAKA
ncbi:MAG: undecaprenyl-diphosphate phosphatase [Eubacterium sp.]|nr:undecaprenyl-diphosphate phosphatase [Eubacterium sp.]